MIPSRFPSGPQRHTVRRTLVWLACAIMLPGCASQPGRGTGNDAARTAPRAQQDNTGWQVLADGSRYRGELDKGQPEGKGTLRKADGSEYHGSFRGGVPDGLVLETTSDGKDHWQIWSAGVLKYDLPGPRTLAAADRHPVSCQPYGLPTYHLLKGRCPQGRPAGKATLYSADHSEIIAGTFDQGLLKQGIRFTTDRDLRDGQWLANYLDKQGTVYEQGQFAYQGGFLAGERHGRGTCAADGKPEPCLYYRGKRVDTAFLHRQLKADLAELNKEHRREIEGIKQITEEKRSELKARFNVRIDRLQRELETQQAIGIPDDVANSSNPRARAITGRYVDNLNRIRARISDTKAARDQQLANREITWQREQREQLQAAQRAYEKTRATIIRTRRQDCEALPGRHWNPKRNLCL